MAAIIYGWREGSPEGHVQNHHQTETHGEEYRADVGMGALGHFGDEFLHHHVKHGPGGEAEQIRQRRHDELRGQQGADGAPIGSTTPESTPPAKARPLPAPSARRGREIMAPSGKFWMAMPRDSASAPAAEICALPER